MTRSLDFLSLHAHELGEPAPLLEVSLLPNKGRGYVATKAIKAGTAVHRARSLAAVVSQEWAPETCMGCFAFSYPKRMRVKAVTENKTPPVKNMNFCSEKCKANTVDACLPSEWNLLTECYARLDWAVQNCPDEDQNITTELPVELDGCISLSFSDDATLLAWVDHAWSCTQHHALYPLQTRPISNIELTVCKLIASCLIRRQCGALAEDGQWPSLSFNDLLAVQNNELVHIRSTTPPGTRLPPITPDCLPSNWPATMVESMQLYQFFSNAIPLDLLEHTPDLFRSIYYREIANSFGIWEMSLAGADAITDDLELLGYGIYPSAVYFNHSCDANISKSRQGSSIVFIAKRDLAVGEEACIAYGSVTEGRQERRQRLKQHYYFDCACKRCEQELQDVATTSNNDTND